MSPNDESNVKWISGDGLEEYLKTLPEMESEIVKGISEEEELRCWSEYPPHHVVECDLCGKYILTEKEDWLRGDWLMFHRSCLHKYQELCPWCTTRIERERDTVKVGGYLYHSQCWDEKVATPLGDARIGEPRHLSREPLRIESKSILANRKAGMSRVCPVSGMTFQWAPAGEFMMGDASGDHPADERPVHTVSLDGFWIGKFTVTNADWMHVMGFFSGKQQQRRRENREIKRHHPAEVTLREAKDFVLQLNVISGLAYRLPTEAEWEYAARSGGRDELFSGSDEVEEVAFPNGPDADARVRDVGLKAPNGLGLHDMSGNIEEWVEDAYEPDAYNHHLRHNPLVVCEHIQPKRSRVARGGGAYHLFFDLRCTSRWVVDGGDTRGVGFRVVVDYLPFVLGG